MLPARTPPPLASVAAGFVTGMLAGVRRTPDGESLVRRLLAETGIPERVLTDATERISVVRYAALYNRLAQALDDEAFALFSQAMRCGSFEFLCRSLITATTLSEALDRATRCLRLLLPDFAIRVEPPKGTGSGGAHLVIALHPESALAVRAADDPARVFAFEWLLRLIHALACWLAGRGLALDAVRFPYPRPAHADDYTLIYTEHSEFADTNGAQLAQSNTMQSTALATERTNTLCATLSANLLDLPVRRDDAALTAFLNDAPGKIAVLYRRDRETVLRVRDLLRAALPERPTLATAARQLHLSARTLHRRLADEGSSFRGIRDALCRDLALARLRKTRQPLGRIAADLGYAEPSAFYRAVVGWTGVAPSAYRRRTGQGETDGSPLSA